mmetsp:Transcript_28974/g.48893  ORF Transcript_28974/g.48893 Transcript_28974/m.48893 type:complete len:224 (-) Transcript_28974:714-1385(-)
MSCSINIVGAGVCGLSVARALKEKYGDFIALTITADKFYDQTTSFAAGGLWEPHLLGDTDPDLVLRWSELSYLHYQSLYFSADAANAGVQQIKVHNLYSDEDNNGEVSDVNSGCFLLLLYAALLSSIIDVSMFLCWMNITLDSTHSSVGGYSWIRVLLSWTTGAGSHGLPCEVHSRPLLQLIRCRSQVLLGFFNEKLEGSWSDIRRKNDFSNTRPAVVAKNDL